MSYGNYPDLNDVKKILVIKLRQLGDVLLTGPVFSSLKKRFPEAEIDAYIYSESSPLLEAHPGVDNLILYDRGWKTLPIFQRLYKEWKLWRAIRTKQYDLVINLTEGDRGALAAKASKAKIRVGFQPKGRWQQKLYTHVVKHCPTLRHTVERNLDPLRKIGIFPAIQDRELFLNVSDRALTSMKNYLGTGSFIIIHPTSRWRFKCQPIDKVRTFTENLIKNGERVVFTSGPEPDEQAMIKEIIQGLDVINLSGKISLSELAALIEMSKLLICVDSLPFHMANALKKKVIAIFGPTSDVTWGPWRNPDARIVTQNFSCRPCYQDGCGGSKKSDCLTTISVDQIMQAYREAMQVSLQK